MTYARNIAALLIPAFAIDLASVVAGSGADGADANGDSIDREDAHSAALLLQADAVLTASQTLTVDVKVQDSADGSTFADAQASVQPASSPIVLAATGKTSAKVKVDCSSLRRYMRFVITPTLSAGATDTAKISGVCALGGLAVERGE